MKISYNWLKQYLKVDSSAEDTAVILTDLGLEVEGVELYESVKGGLKGVVVGHVLECAKHPKAHKLKITQCSQRAKSAGSYHRHCIVRQRGQ